MTTITDQINSLYREFEAVDVSNPAPIGDPESGAHIIKKSDIRSLLTMIAQCLFAPPASTTPAANGDLVVQATSNTSLTFKYKGSDGVVRSASLTLS